jgi:hypothetical protein
VRSIAIPTEFTDTVAQLKSIGVAVGHFSEDAYCLYVGKGGHWRYSVENVTPRELLDEGLALAERYERALAFREFLAGRPLRQRGGS